MLIIDVCWGVGCGGESSKMSPVRQGSPTVLVPYLIRLKLGGNAVSTDSKFWYGD